MASLSLVFDLLARDNASPAFRNVGNAAEKAGKQTSSFGSLTATAMKSAGAALAAAGLASIFTGFIQDARESARISRLTEAAIKSTGGAANVTARQVSELATALSNKTAIDDEAVQSASNLLLTFTRVRNEAGAGNDVFNQATAAVLDMSTAMGTDANSAAMQLGKALNDPIKGLATLGRAGVQFTAQQKEQITAMVEAGDILGAQKVILAELSTQFGGAAEAAADPLARLGVIAGNLGEDVGGFLLPAVEKFADFVSDDLIPGLKTIGGVLGDVGGFLVDNKALVLALGTALAIHLVGGITAVTVAFNRMVLTPAVLGLSSLLGTVLNLPAALRAASSAVAGFLAAAAPIAAVGGVVYALTEFLSTTERIEERLEGATEAGQAFGATLNEQGGELNSTTREAAALAVEAAGLAEAFDDANLSSRTVTEALAGNKQAFEEALAAAEDLDARTSFIGNSWGLLGVTMDVVSGRATENRDAFLALAEGTSAAESFVSELSTAVSDVGEQIATTTAETTDAVAEEIQRWRDQLANVNAAFVEPLSIYQEMVQQVAQTTADSTASAEDSWADYAESAKVSLDDFALALEEQITAQQNWRTNLVTIAQRGGIEVAQILADMGVEGAGYVQAMVDANGEDFARMRELMIQESNLAGAGATTALDNHMRVMEAVGASGGRATATAISRELGIGVADVQRIAAQYGVNLATGVNPLLASLGKPIVQVDRLRGGFTAGFYDGGYTGDGGKFTPAGIVHGGEFVFTKEQTAKAGVRNLEVYAKMLNGYATGGFVSTAAVPKPPSTAPYRTPISTAGDATMGRAYGDTVDWLAANLIPPAAALSGPGRWSDMFAAVQRAFPGVRLHSGFRPGSITATGNLSYHALGRAIDITPDMSIFNWLASNYPGSRELIFSPANGRQIWNGRPHMYSEPTRSDHFDHIHWAMANGGIIGEPVFGVGLNSGDTYSFGERGPETVTPGVGTGGGSAMYEGRLYLDSGQFIGVVRGVLSERDRSLARNTRSALR